MGEFSKQVIGGTGGMSYSLGSVRNCRALPEGTSKGGFVPLGRKAPSRDANGHGAQGVEEWNLGG